MRKVILGLLALSVTLNFVLAGAFAYSALMGSSEITDGRLGLLSRDVEVGSFDGTDTLFVLPKGLLVRDISPTGAGWFEPHRFRLVVTSDDGSLVAYEANPVMAGSDVAIEFYSADLETRRAIVKGDFD